MKEKFYVGIQLNKDLGMCEIFDELEKNDNVIILKHGRDTLVHEMKFINNHSNERQDTGKVHIGFDFHYIVFYYKGRIWCIEPSSHYPFTDENDPGLFNACPYKIIDDGWNYQQEGYNMEYKNINSLNQPFDELSIKDVVYPRDATLFASKEKYLQIYNKEKGPREEEIYNAPHICYCIQKNKEHHVIKCSKTKRDSDGIRRSFEIDLITEKITG